MPNVAKVAPGVRLDEMGSPVFNSIKIADGGLLYESAVSGVTATAGGGQTNAFPLVNEMTRVSTVATAGDSVMLPPSAPGLSIMLENASTNAMQVFGVGTETINNVASGTGVSQMAGSVVIYTCYAAGAWFANGLGTGCAGSLETQSTSPACSPLRFRSGSAFWTRSINPSSARISPENRASPATIRWIERRMFFSVRSSPSSFIIRARPDCVSPSAAMRARISLYWFSI